MQRWLALLFATLSGSIAAMTPERALDSAAVGQLADRLLVVPAVSPPPAGTLAPDALRALLLDPAYQLK